MKITNESKVGIFAVFGLTVLVLGYNFLRGNNLFSDKHQFYAVYERVNGLTRSNPVVYYGYKVGNVERIRFEKSKPVRIVVQFSVEKDINIPENSKAVIVNSGFFGSKALEIHPGGGKQFVQNGDTLPSRVEMSLMEEVNQAISPLRNQVDSTINALNRILESAPVGSISNSFRSIERSLATLENTTTTIDTVVDEEARVLRRVMTNLDKISTRLDAKTMPQIDSAVSNFSALSDSLSKADINATIRESKRTIEQLKATLNRINEGEGTLGMLINDKELYYNLNNASRDLDRLLLDIQNRPGRYVKFPIVDFGKDNGPPQAAEDTLRQRERRRKE